MPGAFPSVVDLRGYAIEGRVTEIGLARTVQPSEEADHPTAVHAAAASEVQDRQILTPITVDVRLFVAPEMIARQREARR